MEKDWHANEIDYDDKADDGESFASAMHRLDVQITEKLVAFARARPWTAVAIALLLLAVAVVVSWKASGLA